MNFIREVLMIKWVEHSQKVLCLYFLGWNSKIEFVALSQRCIIDNSVSLDCNLTNRTLAFVLWLVIIHKTIVALQMIARHKPIKFLGNTVSPIFKANDASALLIKKTLENCAGICLAQLWDHFWVLLLQGANLSIIAIKAFILSLRVCCMNALHLCSRGGFVNK